MVQKKAVSKKKAATRKKAVTKAVASNKKATPVKKKVVKKVVQKAVKKDVKKAVKKKVVRQPTASSTITNEQHYLMVSEAAYHLAEKQGFNPGSDMDNWLKAEKQIAAIMRSGNISLSK